MSATASALYRSRENAPKPKKRDFHQHASHASPVVPRLGDNVKLKIGRFLQLALNLLELRAGAL